MNASISSIIKKYSKEKSETTAIIKKLETPVGNMITIADDNSILLFTFMDKKHFVKRVDSIANELRCEFKEGDNNIIQKLENELNNYFNGKLTEFKVPIKTFGSDYHKEVWKALLKIPHGSTCTYRDIAEMLGKPSNHARAIGAACGANTHIIIIPCHRIVSSSGKGGYSAGNEIKDWLLNHESKQKE